MSRGAVLALVVTSACAAARKPERSEPEAPDPPVGEITSRRYVELTAERPDVDVSTAKKVRAEATHDPSLDPTLDAIIDHDASAVCMRDQS